MVARVIDIIDAARHLGKGQGSIVACLLHAECSQTLILRHRGKDIEAFVGMLTHIDRYGRTFAKIIARQVLGEVQVLLFIFKGEDDSQEFMRVTRPFLEAVTHERRTAIARHKLPLYIRKRST